MDTDIICVDTGITGATTSIVTNNGISVRSCTGGVMIGKSKGDSKLNLPTKAQAGNKMKVNTPLLSVGQAADQGCVAVFTKEKVLICDETKIDIKLTSPPLVKDKRGWKLYCDNSAYTRDMAQDLAMYLHVYTGYHVLITWIRAITKGNNRSEMDQEASTEEH